MKIGRIDLRKNWPHLAVLLASLITIIVWYRHGGLLFYADSTWPIGDPLAHARDFFFGWKSQYSGGIIDATGYAIVPLFLFIGLLQAIGLSPVLAQATFFFIILAMTGSGAIVLLRYLGIKYRIPEKPLALLIPALFYMSNLYIAINGWRMIIFLYIFYAALPILIWLFLKYLDTEKSKYMWVFAIFTAIFVSTALTNLSYLFILFGLLGAIALLYVREKKIRKWLMLMTRAVMIWLPLNIWYLLPQLLSVSDSTSKSTGGGNLSGSFSILNVISSHASFMNVLSLNGYYSLYDNIAGNWFKWAGIFTQSPVGMLSFVLPVILILVAVNKKLLTKAPALVFLGIFLILTGAFFSKGSHDPFGELFIYLFKHFPVPFLAFRAAYEKLGIIVVIGYLIILYLFLSAPLAKLEKYKNWMTGAMLAIVMVLGFPVWTGMIFDSDNGIRTSAHVTIPDDYREVAKLLKQDPNALALSLPLQHHAWISSKWDAGKNGYIGNDILRLLSDTPIISTDIGDKAIDGFNHQVESDFTSAGVDIANINARKIKYVVVRKDINYEWGKAYGYELPKIADLKGGIEASGHFLKRFESQNLVLYELTSPKPQKYIYAADKLYSFDTTGQFKSFDNFIRATLSDQYIFTNSNTTVPTNDVTSLFAGLTSADINIASGTATDTTTGSSSEKAVFYKTNTPLAIKIDAKSNNITFTPHDDGKLSVNGVEPFAADATDYRTTNITPVPNSKYYVHANNEYIAVNSPGVTEVPNRENTDTLEVFATNQGNLIPNGDFKKGTWTPLVEDCAKSDSKSDLSMSLVAGPGANNKGIGLTARNHIACTHQKIESTGKGQYIVSFDYMSPTKSRVGFAVDNGGESGFNPGWSAQPADTKWHHYSQMITLTGNSKSASFFLYSYASDKISENTSTYANVEMSQVKNSSSIHLRASKESAKTSNNGLSKGSVVTYTGSQSDYEQLPISGWAGDVQDCAATDDNPRISLKISKDSKSGDVLKLASKSHTACTNTTLSVLQAADYILSFDFKGSSKTAGGYYLQFNDSSQTVLTEHLNADQPNKRTNKAVHFTAPSGATSASIYFYAFDPSGAPENIAEYSNIQLTRVPDIEGKFYLVNQSGVETASPKNIQFSTPSPVKRSIKVSGATKPFYLVMSENYHSRWQLEMNNAKIKSFGSWLPGAKVDAIPDTDHFKLNDFQNGWYVDVDKLCRQQHLCTQNADGSYDLEMAAEFTPQRWFYIGLAVSGATLAGCLGFLGYSWYRRKHSNIDPQP